MGATPVFVDIDLKFDDTFKYFTKSTLVAEVNSLQNLKIMEKQIGFIKQSLHGKINKKINFFNLGKNNDWRELLDKDIANQISIKFEKEMKELSYLN